MNEGEDTPSGEDSSEELSENCTYNGHKIKWVTGDDPKKGKHVEVYKGSKFVGSFKDEEEAKSAIDNGGLNESVLDEAARGSLKYVEYSATKLDLDRDTIQAMLAKYEKPELGGLVISLDGPVTKKGEVWVHVKKNQNKPWDPNGEGWTKILTGMLGKPYTNGWSDLIEVPNGINEAIQTADAATKVDQESLGAKYPVEGKAFEFADGVFVVDSIIEDVVYLIGPDDEYYSIPIEDFQNEVIAPLNEEDTDVDSRVEKKVNEVFAGWGIEKLMEESAKESGVIMFAICNDREDDVVIFVDTDNETYQMYSPSDKNAPEFSGDLSGLKADMSKMIKHFE